MLPRLTFWILVGQHHLSKRLIRQNGGSKFRGKNWVVNVVNTPRNKTDIFEDFTAPGDYLQIEQKPASSQIGELWHLRAQGALAGTVADKLSFSLRSLSTATILELIKPILTSLSSPDEFLVPRSGLVLAVLGGSGNVNFWVWFIAACLPGLAIPHEGQVCKKIIETELRFAG